MRKESIILCLAVQSIIAKTCNYILIILIRLIHELEVFPVSLSSLISLSMIDSFPFINFYHLWLSYHRSDFFVVFGNEIAFLINVLVYDSLLIYNNATDFWILNLYPGIFLN